MAAGDAHGHGGLSHLPAAAAPAVFAARADVEFASPARPGELELTLARFVAALSDGLADAGCTLVGHIKGTLAARGHDTLEFHATTLAASPLLTGAIAGDASQAALTVNVIVFGVPQGALPAVVEDAWSTAGDARTVWRH